MTHVRGVVGWRRASTLRRLAGVAALLVPVGVASCAREANAPAPVSPAVAGHAGVSGAGFVSEASGESIYGLDLPLVDADGRSLFLSDLGGRTLVAAMVYTSCEAVCPRVAEDMKGVERQLSAEDRQGVTFVLFSLDPGRDTPAALRAFAAARGLDPATWRLLAATDDGVRELSAVLGVKYRAEANGEIAHSAMIFVIDPAGVIRHRQVGLADDGRALVKAVAGARSAGRSS